VNTEKFGDVGLSWLVPVAPESQQLWSEESHPRDEQGRFSEAVGGSSLGTGRENTPEFKSWFRDSKVKLGDRPMIVYHATDSPVNFTEFDVTGVHGRDTIADIGAHFGTKEQAGSIINSRSDKPIDPNMPVREGRRVIPVYLSIQNPLRLPDMSDWSTPHNWIDELKDQRAIMRGPVYSEIAATAREFARKQEDAPGATQANALTHDFLNRMRSVIEKHGYDGIVYRNIHEAKDMDAGDDSYAVFHPYQIKSAIGNKGTFDPKSGHIGMSAGEGVALDATWDETLHPRDDAGKFSDSGGGGGGVHNSPAFKSWFGRSQVVDGTGRPQVMYHSTSGDFTEVRPNTHFGDATAANDRGAVLADFSENVVGRTPDTTSVFPVYLKVENPLRMPDLAEIDSVSGDHYDAAMEDFRSRYSEEEQAHREDIGEAPHPGAWESETDLSHYLYREGVISDDEFEKVQYSPDKAFRLLAEKGYDGIVYKNAVEHAGHDSWIVFDPRNVKSAIGNKGTFDPKNPHMGLAAEWDETLHPRDDAGKFADAAGGGGGNIPKAPAGWDPGLRARSLYTAPTEGTVLPVEHALESLKAATAANGPSKLVMDSFVERHGVLTDDQIARRQATADFMAKERVWMATTPAILGKVLDEGAFKTAHETGQSNGYFDAKARATFEDNYFGSRPLYGYLSDESGQATRAGERWPSTKVTGFQADDAYHYGDVRVEFKPDVRERTTFTGADSWDYNGRTVERLAAGDKIEKGWDVQILPSPLNAPSFSSVNFTSFDQPDRRLGYHEAQIHGGAGPEQIARVVYYPRVGTITLGSTEDLRARGQAIPPDAKQKKNGDWYVEQKVKPLPKILREKLAKRGIPVETRRYK
jgi:hypothetical protein